MQAYTPTMVERILRNYLDIRSTLFARGQQLPDLYVGPRKEGTRHARTITDGKAKARLIEELHVSTIDIANGLQRLHEDDVDIIIKYHVYKTHTLDDLIRERGTVSRGSMQRRVFRAVQRLTRVMES